MGIVQNIKDRSAAIKSAIDSTGDTGSRFNVIRDNVKYFSDKHSGIYSADFVLKVILDTVNAFVNPDPEAASKRGPVSKDLDAYRHCGVEMSSIERTHSELFHAINELPDEKATELKKLLSNFTLTAGAQCLSVHQEAIAGFKKISDSLENQSQYVGRLKAVVNELVENIGTDITASVEVKKD